MRINTTDSTPEDITNWLQNKKDELKKSILEDINSKTRQYLPKKILINNLLFPSIEDALVFYFDSSSGKDYLQFRDVIKKRIKLARQNGYIDMEKIEHIFTTPSPKRFSDITVNGKKYKTFAKVCEALGLKRQSARKKHQQVTKRMTMSYDEFFNLSEEKYKEILELPTLQNIK